MRVKLIDHICTDLENIGCFRPVLKFVGVSRETEVSGIISCNFVLFELYL